MALSILRRTLFLFLILLIIVVVFVYLYTELFQPEVGLNPTPFAMYPEKVRLKHLLSSNISLFPPVDIFDANFTQSSNASLFDKPINGPTILLDGKNENNKHVDKNIEINIDNKYRNSTQDQDDVVSVKYKNLDAVNIVKDVNNFKNNTEDGLIPTSDKSAINATVIEQPPVKNLNNDSGIADGLSTDNIVSHASINTSNQTLTAQQELTNLKQKYSENIRYDIFGQWKSEKAVHTGENDLTKERHQKVDRKPAKYAVISGSTPQGSTFSKYNYVFNLPLTVIAWERIGYKTIVLISGSELVWKADPVLSLIYSYLQDLKATVHFINAKDENLVMISQTSRLFVSCIIPDLIPDDILVTSDADVWPINHEAYIFPEDKKLMVLNARCCGHFKHKNLTAQHFPIVNIIATLEIWKSIMFDRHSDVCPKNSDEILDYFEKEFGRMVRFPVAKGENEGWFLDQHMISVRIEEWIQILPFKSVLHFVDRNVGQDRLDRSSWQPRRLGAMVDSHLLENLYEPAQWLKVQPLLIMLYGEGSTFFSLCQRYRDDFMSVMSEAKRSTSSAPVSRESNVINHTLSFL